MGRKVKEVDRDLVFYMYLTLYIGCLGNVVFVVIELMQIITEGFNYFLDLWNYLDILTLCLTFYVMFMDFNAVFDLFSI